MMQWLNQEVVEFTTDDENDVIQNGLTWPVVVEPSGGVDWMGRRRRRTSRSGAGARAGPAAVGAAASR